MTIQSISRVQLQYPVGLETEVSHFYGELLGMAPVRIPAGPSLRFAARGQRVELLPVQGQPAAPVHLAFEVEDLPTLRNRLLDAALPLEESTALPGYLRFSVKDPAGNQLEFIEPDPTPLQ